MVLNLGGDPRDASAAASVEPAAEAAEAWSRASSMAAQQWRMCGNAARTTRHRLTLSIASHRLGDRPCRMF